MRGSPMRSGEMVRSFLGLQATNALSNEKWQSEKKKFDVQCNAASEAGKHV